MDGGLILEKQRVSFAKSQGLTGTLGLTRGLGWIWTLGSRSSGGGASGGLATARLGGGDSPAWA